MIMKKLAIFSLVWVALMLPATLLQAQCKVQGNTYLKVLSGTVLQTPGNFNTNGHFIIYGDVIINGDLSSADAQALEIHSTSTGNGSLVFSGGNPEATVYRYISNNTWHQVSIPVDAATVRDFFFDRNPKTWLARWNTSTSAWDFLTSLGETLHEGEGLDYYIQDQSKTVAFTGRLTPSDFTVTNSASSYPKFISAGGGYNLIGNPYSAPIKVDDNGSDNWDFFNMEQTVWVLDKASGGNYRNRTTGGSGNLTGGVIAMGQAFFVHAMASSCSITIPAVRRVHSAEPFYKNAKES
jgi:hypothetical protein